MPTLYHPFSTACTALVLVLALDRKKKKSEKKSGRQIACQPLNKHFTMKKKSIKQLFASKFPVEHTATNADGKSTAPHQALLPPVQMVDLSQFGGLHLYWLLNHLFSP